ncbi:helix-turn-helix domain-containing protein [Vibrio sp. Of14-4]|uniref:helix-turn-helix domain-containing protein n=1 Tax=Vibrio sp. Of14-4 TaxID=2724878 RepID=UPI001EF34121|nr:helix-turn-helix transcriptional regulator [Vibrio sp. Of14-4]MCG7489567.1 helix-turn-helix domain-containing protein [Vibrio sp. Of14-4]
MADNPFITSGNRVQYLRHLLNHSRTSFSERYGISPSTLRQWESSKKAETSERVSIILSEALRGELNINVDWLRTGEGNSPTLKETRQLDFYDLSVAYDDAFRLIDRYRSEKLEIITISNNDWRPWLSSGDIVIASQAAKVPIKNRLYIVTSNEGIRYSGFIISLENSLLTLDTGNGTIENLYKPLDIMKVIQIRYLS